MPYRPGGLSDLIEDIAREYTKIFEQHVPAETSIGSRVGLFEHPLFERARGFKKAGDVISDSIMERYNQFNAEMIPAALWLYRHSIELNLKFMRSQLVERVSAQYKYGKDHKLLDLWSPIQTYLETQGLTFEPRTVHYRVAEAVREFSEIDVDAQLFRYPDSASPAAKNWIRIDFRNLKLSAAEVDLLAFGFDQMLSFFEAQNEPEAP